MKTIIVYSAVGGSGRTTLTQNLENCFLDLNKKVSVISTDPCYPCSKNDNQDVDIRLVDLHNCTPKEEVEHWLNVGDRVILVIRKFHGVDSHSEEHSSVKERFGDKVVFFDSITTPFPPKNLQNLLDLIL